MFALRLLYDSFQGSASLVVSAGVQSETGMMAQCLRVRWPPVPVVVM